LISFSYFSAPSPRPIATASGDGGYFVCRGSPGPVVPEPPGPLVVGDFNRDGNLDIAVINVQVSTVTILLGNGHGGFTAEPEAPAVGADKDAIVAGDLNADGNLDLVVAN
jgi:FG-GAP-like repeat